MAVTYGSTPAQSIYPKTIPGLQLWLDANDKNTIFDSNTGGSLVTTNGGLVGRWEDKSGNGRHALQSSSGVRPTLELNIQNNLNCMRFDGTNYFSSINTSSTTSAFIICVFKIDNDPPTSTSFTGHPFGTISNANSHSPWVDGIIYDATFTSGRKTTSNPSRSLTLFTMYSVQSQSNSWISKINSIEFFNTTSNTFQNTSIFQNSSGAYKLKGYIGEIISYSPIPSIADIEKIQMYLNAKWRVY
jgi:hypothetical protein